MKTKTVKHYLQCEAPICAGYSLDGLIWYPDEPICNMRPMQKWQKMQKKIAALAKQNLKMNHDFYTIEMLKNKKRIRRETTGKNPNRRQKIEEITRLTENMNELKSIMITSKLGTLQGGL